MRVKTAKHILSSKFFHHRTAPIWFSFYWSLIRNLDRHILIVGVE